jgi:acetyltransferase-like isoleucine patch superfamily enzyme
MGSDVTINLNKDSELSLGFKTILGNRVEAKVSSTVSIEDFCYISDSVRIDSLNDGIVYFDGIDNYDKKIILGTHTLLCKGSIINGGTSIGDETIVREYTVVRGNFPPQCVISGVPAKVIEYNINWKHNFDYIWNYKN